jgi:hypothetical protein
VVVIDFWTYSCINCLRTLPYLAWNRRYRTTATIIGCMPRSSPFEERANVRRAVSELGITYPVAIDNDYAIWRAFDGSTGRLTTLSTRRVASAVITSARAPRGVEQLLIHKLLTEAGQRDLPGASGAMRAAASDRG